ncbi:hypothetical protein EOD39_6385 [Acipenser ruthenus]|uniref:Uncharacterized protein n=1 Tax=Acipenser ruthenus TaxID=7906 RepID=A0A662YZS5_ACIRT|nr:hypothetical protein EOD39_6385 [Acipenser ruthenus]
MDTDNDMNEDAAEGMTQEEVKKYTPPSKKSKKKKLNKDEDSNEAEEDNDKTESADAEMESQKEALELEMQCGLIISVKGLKVALLQQLHVIWLVNTMYHSLPEEADKPDNTDAEMESQNLDVNTKQEKPTKGQKHGDDPMEDRAETEDPNLDSKELSRGGSKPEDELMEDQGVAGDVKDP